MESHPSWVCGLKLQQMLMMINFMLSHPSWVCGLKQTFKTHFRHHTSHTLRGCVD